MTAPFSNRNLARHRRLDVRNQFILKGKFVYENISGLSPTPSEQGFY